jgi:integrase
MIEITPPLSFAVAVAAIEAATDLPEQTRRHWACSLRQIAKWLDRPEETIAARLTSIALAMKQLHHTRLGVTAKTLANHRANVRAALRWFGKEQGVPSRGTPLSPKWAILKSLMTDKGQRARLSSLMRYCSAKGIAPSEVDDAAVESVLRYRAQTIAMAGGIAAQRSIARTWNANAGSIQGWPAQRLTEPPIQAAEGPGWEQFPEGLRLDVDNYLATLSKIRKGMTGRRSRPCKARTIKTRRAELVAVAKMAVRQGIPIDTLTSFRTLLAPDVVERVILAYWEMNGKEPKVFTIDLGWKLLAIARATRCLDEPALVQLDGFRATLEEYRRSGLTPKNLDIIRKVLTEGIWSDVASLPWGLMKEARLAKDHAPVKAAVTAQMAVAIAILTVAPVRLSNLVAIQLDENLIKPGGFDSTYWLKYRAYDVKNRVDLDFEFDKPLTDLINEYVHEFRPTLMRGFNGPALFPGEAGDFKTANMFSTQITDRVLKATGLRISVHQFRHAAAAIYLKDKPGNYETVRRFLGHRCVQTTIHFYCGLGTIQATEEFAKIVRRHIKFEPEDA